MKSKSVTVNGVRVRWLEEGHGIPVILLHGIPTSPLLWRHVIPLVKDARCMAWEMVGYGESIPEGRGRDISVARQADYLLSWMDAIGLPLPCSRATTLEAAWRTSRRPCARRRSQACF